MRPRRPGRVAQHTQLEVVPHDRVGVAVDPEPEGGRPRGARGRHDEPVAQVDRRRQRERVVEGVLVPHRARRRASMSPSSSHRSTVRALGQAISRDALRVDLEQTSDAPGAQPVVRRDVDRRVASRADEVVGFEYSPTGPTPISGAGTGVCHTSPVRGALSRAITVASSIDSARVGGPVGVGVGRRRGGRSSASASGSG